MDELFRYITIGLTILTIWLFRIGFKKKSITNSNIVKQPIMYFWGGLFVSIIFAVLIALLPILPTSSDLESKMLFNIFAVLMIIVGVLFIWYYIAWEIRLEAKGFTYKNFFGKSYDFLYIECTSVTKSARIDIYHKEKCVIKVSALSNNWYELSKRVEPNMDIYNKK